MTYTLRSKKITYTFSDLGGELISAKNDKGEEFIWRGEESIWNKHAPLLFPLCGRLKNAKYTYGGKEYELGAHGFLSKTVMNVTEQTESSITFELTSSDDTRAVYPFDFSLTAVYSIEGDTITAKICVKNRSECEMPFMLGGHPGFSTDIGGLVLEDHYLDFGVDTLDIYPIINKSFVSPTSKKYSLKDGRMPLTRKELVDLATVVFKDAPMTVTLASDKSEHKIIFSYSESLPYFCIWTAESEKAQYVCLEPWSGVPNDGVSDEVFETRPGMVRLAPGDSADFEYKITIV